MLVLSWIIVAFCFVLQTSWVQAALAKSMYVNHIPVYENVEIVDGIPSCDSNCSYISSRQKKWMTCYIEDCDHDSMTEVEDFSIPPQIVDVSFIKHNNVEDGKENLALKIEWSPPDYGILKYTTGYLLNITDGITSYIKCYQLYDKMNFRRNKKDIFENSCFGNYPQTYVRPGSVIRASISSLPLSKNNPDHTKVDLDIRVPTYDAFPARACSQNCNTFAMNASVNTTHTVQCGFDKNAKNVSACAKLPQKAEIASAPIKYERAWYKYRDIDDNKIKLALNFSWSHEFQASMENATGFFIEVFNGMSVLYTKCFSISISDHLMNANFFIDCFGREANTTINLGTNYIVKIWSLPQFFRTEYKIYVPNCEDPEMYDVSECQGDGALTGSTVINCDNKTIRYSYKVPWQYGTRGIVAICQENRLGELVNICNYYTDLKPNGILYDIALPSDSNLTKPYQIKLMGNIKGEHILDTMVNFLECSAKVKNTDVALHTIPIVIFSFVFVFIIIAIFIFLRLCVHSRRRILAKLNCKCRRNHQREEFELARLDVNVDDRKTDVPGEQENEQISLRNDVNIFVIASQDYDYHNKVVSNFCSFLKKDLGLDVDTPIWSIQQMYQNPYQYFLEKIMSAEKVIIICSKENRNCLQKKDRNISTDNEDICNCMFCRVIKHICGISFGSENGKFLVGYFSYSSDKDIPEQLSKMNFPVFKLMDEFERLYFRLIDTEQYIKNGMKICEEQVTQEGIHDTEYGQRLFEAIDRAIKSIQLENLDRCDLSDADIEKEFALYNSLPWNR